MVWHALIAILPRLFWRHQSSEGLSANLLLLVNEAEPWITRLWTAEAGERSGFSLSRSKYPDVSVTTLWGGWGPWGWSMSPGHYPGCDPGCRDIIPGVTSWSAHHVSCQQSQQPNLQSSPLYGHMSRCRQQYLNLASTLPKIPTKILGFQIRNILKNCISWGLENIYLSTELY